MGAGARCVLCRGGGEVQRKQTPSITKCQRLWQLSPQEHCLAVALGHTERAPQQNRFLKPAMLNLRQAVAPTHMVTTEPPSPVTSRCWPYLE